MSTSPREQIVRVARNALATVWNARGAAFFVSNRLLADVAARLQGMP